MRKTLTLKALMMTTTVLTAFTAHSATLVQNISAGWDSFSDKVATTWQQPEGIDFYLPAITWHNRATYDREHIKKIMKGPGAQAGESRATMKKATGTVSI